MDVERPEFADTELDGDHVRVLTVPLERGGSIQLARSLESTDDVLARLRWVLLALVLGGIALAAALGRLAARHLVAPVVRVTEAARHIEETEDLGRRIEVASADEVGQLATRFNAMLDTLEGSIAAQRQLVADASHELRTPVTSLRTNIEVLAENRLDGAERKRLVADVQAQAEELSALVADLIELARGDQPSPAYEDVRLDALVAEAVERARRHAPGVTFETALEPAVVDGVPDRLARAVNNLLDNAARHGRTVTVSATRPASASATTAAASPPTTCRTSSTASTAAPTPAAGRAPASASPSSARSPSSTAARSARQATATEPCSNCALRVRPPTMRRGAERDRPGSGRRPRRGAPPRRRCPRGRRRSGCRWRGRRRRRGCGRPRAGASAPGASPSASRARRTVVVLTSSGASSSGPQTAVSDGDNPRRSHSGSAKARGLVVATATGTRAATSASASAAPGTTVVSSSDDHT